MHKQHWIALSLAFGLFASPLNSVDPVGAQAVAPSIAATNSPSKSPQIAVPQATVDAFKKLEKAQREFNNSLADYLFSLEAIATSKSASASDPTLPDPEPPDYEKPRTALNGVNTASQALETKIQKLSDAGLEQRMNGALTALNQATQSMRDKVLDPLSETDETGKKGVENAAAVENTQNQLNILKDELTAEKGKYTTPTHNKILALASAGLITFITLLSLLSRKLGQSQIRRNKDNLNPQARDSSSETRSDDRQQPEDSDQITIHRNRNRWWITCWKFARPTVAIGGKAGLSNRSRAIPPF